MFRAFAPAVTVAAVIEHAGRFLMVEEETPDGVRINQPAGHLDSGESLVQAVVREVLEETACHFEPAALTGVYLWRREENGTAVQDSSTYLRFAFAGSASAPIPGRALDQGILRAIWLTEEELQACRATHRSPLVLQCIADYRQGQRAALDLLYTHASALGR